MSFFVRSSYTGHWNIFMGKFKEWMMDEEARRIEREEIELNLPTKLSDTVLRWADELQKVIDTNSFATNKWGVHLNEWDEEPQN